jgi:hypothetical protein
MGLLVWIHLHRVRSLCLHRLCLRCLSCSLLASSFRLLLLLDTWSNGLVDSCVLQIHWGNEWTSELLLCDEWVQFGLLGRPSLKGIDG